MSEHWLIKSEPDKYPWSRLVSDGRTSWDGVRNFEARNNLRAMKVGDLAFFYHSNVGKEIVGVAKVVRAAYPDASAPGLGPQALPGAGRNDWSVVDFAPAYPLAVPVTLATIKATRSLAGMLLVKRSRISVVGVTPAEFKQVLAMGKTRGR